MFIRSLVATAALAVCASGAFGGDVVVGPNGLPQVAQGTTGTAANPYQLGTLDADWSIMQVTLTALGPFNEFATFTVPASATTEGVGTSYSLIIDLFGPFTIWDITGFTTTVKGGTPLAAGATYGVPYGTGASFGFALAPGSYFLNFAGTAIGLGDGAQYSASLRALPVPEPESYAMMLAGLGAVSFVAWRRRRTV